MLLIRQLQGRMNVVNCMDFVLTSWWFVRRHSAFRSCMLRINFLILRRVYVGTYHVRITDGRKTKRSRKEEEVVLCEGREGRTCKWQSIKSGNKTGKFIKL